MGILGSIVDTAEGALGDVADTATGVLGDAVDTAGGVVGTVEHAATGLAGSLLDQLTGRSHDDDRAALAARQAAAARAGEDERSQIDDERRALVAREGATTAYDPPQVASYPDENFDQWSHQAIKDLLDSVDVGGLHRAADTVTSIAHEHLQDLVSLQSDLASIVGDGWQGRSADAAATATAAHLEAAQKVAASTDEVSLALRQTASVATQAQQTVGEPEPFDAGDALRAGLGSIPFGGGSLLPDLFDLYQREEEARQHAVAVAQTWQQGYVQVSSVLPVLTSPPSPVVGAPTPAQDPRDPGTGDLTPQPAIPGTGGTGGGTGSTGGGSGSTGGGSGATGGAPGQLAGLLGTGGGSTGQPGGSGTSPAEHHDGPGCCCQDCCGSDGSAGAAGATPAGTSAASLAGLDPTGSQAGTLGAGAPGAGGLGAGGLGAGGLGSLPQAGTHAAAFDPAAAGLLGSPGTGGAGSPSAASLLRAAGLGGPGAGTGAAGSSRPAGSFGPLGSSSGTFGTPAPTGRPASGGAAAGAGARGAGMLGTVPAASGAPAAGPGGAAGEAGGRGGFGGMPMMGGGGGRGKGGGEHRRADYLVSPEHSAELVGDMPLVAPPVIGER